MVSNITSYKHKNVCYCDNSTNTLHYDISILYTESGLWNKSKMIYKCCIVAYMNKYFFNFEI